MSPKQSRNKKFVAIRMFINGKNFNSLEENIYNGITISKCITSNCTMSFEIARIQQFLAFVKLSCTNSIAAAFQRGFWMFTYFTAASPKLQLQPIINAPLTKQTKQGLENTYFLKRIDPGILFRVRHIYTRVILISTSFNLCPKALHYFRISSILPTNVTIRR